MNGDDEDEENDEDAGWGYEGVTGWRLQDGVTG